MARASPDWPSVTFSVFNSSSSDLLVLWSLPRYTLDYMLAQCNPISHYVSISNTRAALAPRGLWHEHRPLGSGRISATCRAQLHTKPFRTVVGGGCTSSSFDQMGAVENVSSFLGFCCSLGVFEQNCIICKQSSYFTSELPWNARCFVSLCAFFYFARAYTFRAFMGLR